MTTEHTPGPWIANGFDIVHRPIQFNGKPLCDLPIIGVAESRGAIPDDDDEAEANARLIAAAPDLLAACEDVRDDLGVIVERNDLFGMLNIHAPQLHASWDKLEAAITKAKGE